MDKVALGQVFSEYPYMGRVCTCSMHGSEKKYIYSIDGKARRKETTTKTKT
jgi:hypothetical protein